VFPVISVTTGGPGANDHKLDVGFASVPTAANVSLQGQITTQGGNGIRNVQVTLTDGAGVSRTVLTGSFGYYRFDNILAGDTVVVSVSAKRFRFTDPIRVVTVNDDLVDMDFVSSE
jgi:Carboxypeptidase regulatory-like domain